MATLTPEEKKAKRRKMIAQEIAATEASYLDGLSVIVEVYLMPLQAQRCIPQDDVTTIFSNVYLLLGMHTNFSAQLGELIRNWSPTQAVGALFIQYAPFFKAYTQYVNNHNEATVRLRQLEKQKHAKFLRFCTTALADPRSKGANLTSLLITPIQRIPRYKLLLSELIAHTDEDHPDMSDLRKAEEIIKLVASHINEALRSAENQQIIYQIQEDMVGNNVLVSPSRLFVRKDKLNRVCRRDVKIFYFFLFNDLLIYAIKAGWKFKPNQIIKIDHLFRIEDIPESKESNGTMRYSWKVINPVKSFVVFTHDRKQKELWFNDMQKCVDQVQQASARRIKSNAPANHQQVAIWQQNSDAHECNRCKKAFSFVRRKHHCRMCGLIFCGKCTNYSKSINNQNVRVCQPCHSGSNEKKTEPETETETETETEPAAKKEVDQADMFAKQLAAIMNSNPGDFKRRRTRAKQKETDNSANQRPDNSANQRPAIDPRLPTSNPRASSKNSPKTSRGSSFARTPRQGGGRSSFATGYSRVGTSNSKTSEAEVAEAREKLLKLTQSDDVMDSWVWFEDETEGFIAGTVENAGSNGVTFRTSDGSLVTRNYQEVGKVEKASVVGGELEGITQEEDLPEGAILNQLKMRYKQDSIYTYMGDILVSVNPFKMLPIYSNHTLQMYTTTDVALLDAEPPHIFRIASDAVRGIFDGQGAQSIVISGESGAGKTEATKLVLQFVSQVCESETTVEQETLYSNALLEAFGNAKTVRNNNSSRFGKWLDLIINVQRREIVGAKFTQYLLETTRVAFQSTDERNYHIFYQLCALVDDTTETSTTANAELNEWDQICEPESLRSMGFGAASSFHYLNQGTCVIDGIDDGNEIQSTLEALGHMGFTASELADLFRILASILLLGNITFEAGEQENESKVSNPPQLARAAEALRVTPEALSEALVARLIETKNENTRVALSPDRARSSRDAIAKNMYKELFSWLIGRVNIRVAKDPVIAAADTKANSVDMSLGLLDIFGFEVFDFNSLEQFFINYANEKLQQHFNQHTFQREQKLYTDEGITVPQAAYQDNDVCLALIENNKSPPGILRMMNEEVAKPSGSDDTLYTRMKNAFNEITETGRNSRPNACFSTPRRSNSDFTVQHHAGPVTYCITGFVEKNRDKLYTSLSSMLQSSSNPLLSSLFTITDIKTDNKKTTEKKMSRAALAKLREEQFAEAAKDRKKTKNKKTVSTVAGHFRAALANLVSTINGTTPHFVRCIKPNHLKESHNFDAFLVLQQMRNSGLFDALKIRARGFPFRLLHADFVERFRCLSALSADASVQDVLASDDTATRAKVDAIISLLTVLHSNPGNTSAGDLDLTSIRVGTTKVMWSKRQRFVLEALRRTALDPEAAAAAAEHAQDAANAAATEAPLLSSSILPSGKRPPGPPPRKKSAAPARPARPKPKVPERKNLRTSEELLALRVKQEARRPPPPPSRKGRKGPPPIPRAASKAAPTTYPLSAVDTLRASTEEHKERLTAQYVQISQPVLDLSHYSEDDVEAATQSALEVFANILSWSGIRLHPYPSTTGLEVVRTGLEKPYLVDEIYAQLIKQTTLDLQGNDSFYSTAYSSTLSSWKLLYICLLHFQPSAKLMPVVMAHASTNKKDGVDMSTFTAFVDAADIAAHCYAQVQDMSEQKDAWVSSWPEPDLDLISRLHSQLSSLELAEDQGEEYDLDSDDEDDNFSLVQEEI